MNYQEALEYVEGCKQYGIVPGLDSIRRLLKKLGNPQEELKYVHIAGTNGKGSVLAMLSSVLSPGQDIGPEPIPLRQCWNNGRAFR